MAQARRNRGWSSIWHRGAAGRGPFGPGCRSGETPLPLTLQPVADEVEVCKSEHREGAGGVLGQTSVSHLDEAPQTFDDMKRMLAASPMTGSTAVDGTLKLSEGTMTVPTPIDSVGHARRPEPLAVRLTPVRLIGEDFALPAVQQGIDLRDVRCGRRGCGQVMHQATTIGANVQLHAKVPGLALAGLAHLRVAALRRVLRRTRSCDDR